MNILPENVLKGREDVEEEKQMPRKLFLQIEIKSDDGNVRKAEYAYDLSDKGTPDYDIEWFSYYLSTEAQVESIAERFLDPIPDPSAICTTGSLSFKIDLSNLSAYYDSRNSEWLWNEICSLLGSSRIYLARARAYHELQPTYSGKPGKENNVLYRIHLRTMDEFHLAVKNIKKLEDMILRLIFEALGASFEGIDTSTDEWERQLTLERVMEFLKGRDTSKKRQNILKLRFWCSLFHFKRARVNEKLKNMPEAEYIELRAIVGQMRHGRKHSQGVKKSLYDFWQYRHALEHRLPKSVDLAELYTVLEQRPKPLVKTNKLTVMQGFIGSQPSEADWRFEDLYDTTVAVYEHYLGLLVRLNELSTFKRIK